MTTPSMADCLDRAAQLLADASAEREQLAAAEGPEAVAQAALWPGHHLTAEGIARRYEEIAAGARKRAA